MPGGSTSSDRPSATKPPPASDAQNLDWLRPVLDRSWSLQPPRAAGYLLILLGSLIALSAVVVSLAFELTGRYVGAAVVVIGGILVRAGMRSLHPTVAAALARDRRPPILLFRDFSLDGRGEPDVLHLFLTAAFAYGPDQAIEFKIARLVRRSGPLIALGRPADRRVPSLGASRIYTKDQDWEELALILVQNAAGAVFLVMDMSMTEAMATEWEMARNFLPKGRVFMALTSSSRRTRIVQLSKDNERFCRATGINPCLIQPPPVSDFLTLRFEQDRIWFHHSSEGLVEAFINAGMNVVPAKWRERRPKSPWMLLAVFLGVIVLMGVLVAVMVALLYIIGIVGRCERTG